MSLDITERLAEIDARVREIQPLLNYSYRRSDGKRTWDKSSQPKPILSPQRPAESEKDNVKEEDYQPEAKKMVESTVIPVCTSISREQKIQELGKAAGKEDKTRNRRMFSGILGLLGSRQKSVAEDKQTKKQEEVEVKLAHMKKREVEEAKQVVEDRKRAAEEAEREMARLTREKAIIQYAENKITHYELLKKAIQTKTKPVIFYLPAKHNVRSLELHNSSVENIDRLIELRKNSLKDELERSRNMPLRESRPEKRRRDSFGRSFSTRRSAEQRSRRSSLNMQANEDKENRVARSRSRSYSHSDRDASGEENTIYFSDDLKPIVQEFAVADETATGEVVQEDHETSIQIKTEADTTIAVKQELEG